MLSVYFDDDYDDDDMCSEGYGWYNDYHLNSGYDRDSNENLRQANNWLIIWF